MNQLAERLADRSRPLVGDGAIGTWLVAGGVPTSALPRLALDDPERIMTLHLEYLKAGADVIETATFLANPIKLGALGVEQDVFPLCRRAAQLARHARDTFGKPAWILGALGPLGRPVARTGLDGVAPEKAEEAYKRSVAGLLAGGVDGFILETFSDLGSLAAALRAVRGESDLPVVASLSFSTEGETLYGLTPEQAVKGLLELPGGPPDVIGANCGTGPMPLLDAILRMAPMVRKHDIPLAAYPNAGQVSRGRTGLIYPASATYMAGMVPALFEAGCTLVGGCCGTTPEHVSEIARALHARPVSAPILSPPVRPSGPEEEGVPLDAPEGSSLAEKLKRGSFVVSVELDPPRAANPERLIEAAERLRELPVDTINVGDSPMARVRMSAMSASLILKQKVGIEPIVHFTTRDRNLMGIESDLLGGHALGMRNILCLTGDPPGLGDYAHASAVYDVDSVGLTKILTGLNRGDDGFGHKIGQPTRFLIGVGVNQQADDMNKELGVLRRKLDAGAHFVMSQLLYDPTRLEEFLAAFGPLPVPLLVGVMPLVSFRQAQYLHHEVPGIDIPKAQRDRMEAAGTAGVEAGVELAMDIVERVKGFAQGLYLVPSFNKVEPLVPLLQHIASIKASRG